MSSDASVEYAFSIASPRLSYDFSSPSTCSCMACIRFSFLASCILAREEESEDTKPIAAPAAAPQGPKAAPALAPSIAPPTASIATPIPSAIPDIVSLPKASPMPASALDRNCPACMALLSPCSISASPSCTVFASAPAAKAFLKPLPILLKEVSQASTSRFTFFIPSSIIFILPSLSPFVLDIFNSLNVASVIP